MNISKGYEIKKVVRKIEMREDYVTQDGSITLDSLVLYTICAEEMRDFLEVQGQLEPAVKSRIQELLQVECGDRTTDEVVSEIAVLQKRRRLKENQLENLEIAWVPV